MRAKKSGVSSDDNQVSVMKRMSRLWSDMSETINGILLRTEREFMSVAFKEWQVEINRFVLEGYLYTTAMRTFLFQWMTYL